MIPLPGTTLENILDIIVIKRMAVKIGFNSNPLSLAKRKKYKESKTGIIAPPTLMAR